MRRGVVFDFDGVLVCSMELHAEAFRRVLRPYQIDVRDEEVFLREGARSETIIADFLQQQGIPPLPEDLRRLGNEKQRTFASLGPPSLYPGAEDLVRGVRPAATRMGLVTGTRRENVTRLLGDLENLFDAVLAQDAYHHDKPHPEPYARTAEALGFPAANLAALENAPRGVRSAKAARYAYVVGITTTVARSVLLESGADAVVDSHEEASQGLLEWLAGKPPRA